MMFTKIKVIILAWTLLGPGFLFAETPQTLFSEGTLFYTKKNYQAAERSLSQLIREYPDFIRSQEAEYTLFLSWFYQKKFQQVLENFPKFQRKYPSGVFLDKLFYWKASSEMGLFQYEKAFESFKIASIRPGIGDLKNKALYFGSICAEKINKFQESLGLLKDFLEFDKNSDFRFQGLHRFSTISFKLKDYEGALKAADLLITDYDNSKLRIEGLILKGEILYTLLRREESYSLFLQAFDNPDLPDEKKEKVFFKLVLLSDEIEKIRDERFSYDSFLRNYPNSEYSLEILGILAKKSLASKNWKDSEIFLKKIIAQTKDPQLLGKTFQNLGLIHSEQNQWKKAGDSFSEAIRVLGKTESVEDSFVSAIWAYRQAKEYKSASLIAETYLQTYKKGKNRETVLKILLDINFETNNLESTMITLNLLIQDYPKSSNLPQYLFQRGQLFFKQNQNLNATQDFNRLVRDFPTYEFIPETKYYLGFLASKSGDFIKAEGIFFLLAEELKKGDLYEKSLIARGISLYNAEKFEKSKTVFKRFLLESPKSKYSKDAFIYLSRNEFKLGNILQSIKILEDSLVELNEISSKNILLWEISNLYFQNKEYEKSIAILNKLIPSSDDSLTQSQIDYQLGLAYFENKNFELASTYFKKSLQNGFQKEPSLFFCGLSNLRQGKIKDSIEKWDLLAHEFPKSSRNPEVLFLLAEYFESIRDYNSMIPNLEKILISWEESDWADKGLLKLSQLIFTENAFSKTKSVLLDFLKKSIKKRKDIYFAKIIVSGLINQGRIENWKDLIDLFKDPIFRSIQIELRLGMVKAFQNLESMDSLEILKNILQEKATLDQKSEALFLLGEIYFSKGKKAEAKEQFEILAGLNDSDFKFWGYLGLSKIEEEKENHVAALNFLEKILEAKHLKNDLQAQALFDSWSILSKIKNPRAEEMKLRLIKDWPSHPLTKKIILF